MGRKTVRQSEKRACAAWMDPKKAAVPVREGLTRLNTLPVERAGRNAYTYFHSV